MASNLFGKNLEATPQNGGFLGREGYTGIVHFTSSDAQAVLPNNYNFVLGDGGVHTFSGSISLKTAGTQSITANDTVTGTITGAQSGISVSHNVVSRVVVSPASDSVTVGGTKTYSATASDVFGNSWGVGDATSWSIDVSAGGSCS